MYKGTNPVHEPLQGYISSNLFFSYENNKTQKIINIFFITKVKKGIALFHYE